MITCALVAGELPSLPYLRYTDHVLCEVLRLATAVAGSCFLLVIPCVLVAGELPGLPYLRYTDHDLCEVLRLVTTAAAAVCW